MKKMLLSILILFTGLFAIEVDLNLYNYDLVDEDILNYYDAREAVFTDYTELTDDSLLYNVGHFGLAFLELGYTGTNIDSFMSDIFGPITEFEENAENFGDDLDSLLSPLLYNLLITLSSEEFNEDSLQSLIINISNFLVSETVGDLEGSWEDFAYISDSLAEIIGDIFDDHGEIFDESLENFFSHMDTVVSNDADFEFVLNYIDSLYADPPTKTNYDTTTFIFSREMFVRMDDFADHLGEFDANLQEGFEIMDELSEAGEGDVQPAIDAFIDGFAELDAALDTLSIILIKQPFEPLEIEPDGLDSLQEVIAEIDSLLKGKTYILEEGEDGEDDFIIRPVGIIENLPFGLADLFFGMYLTDDITTYTFGNIFPNSVPGIERYACDLVINHEVPEEEFEHYLTMKEVEYGITLISDFYNYDANVGIALIEMYRLSKKYDKDFSKIFKYLDEGRIDSVFLYFDDEEHDHSETIDKILEHLENVIDYNNDELFVILWNDAEYSFTTFPPSYDDAVEEGDEFYPVNISPDQIESLIGTYFAINYAIEMIGASVDTFIANADEYIDISLDPEKLNFSNIETDLDLINALEYSNPEFLALTEAGKENIHELGGDIGEALADASEGIDSTIIWMEEVMPYLDTLDVDISEIVFALFVAGEIVDTLDMDFNIPGQTTFIEGENVDFSTWFDNPPDNLLQLWKNFVTGTDSSLGGLFPDRGPVFINQENGNVIPEKFCLHPVYPNPFNPTTTIEFDLPKSAEVELLILNLKGEKVDEIVAQQFNSGHFTYTWDAAKFSSGVYFCYLKLNGNITVQKMTLLK